MNLEVHHTGEEAIKLDGWEYVVSTNLSIRNCYKRNWRIVKVAVTTEKQELLSSEDFKAPGIYGIYSEFLKAGTEQLEQPLKDNLLASRDLDLDLTA